MKAILLITAVITLVQSTNKCRILALGGGGSSGAYQAGAIEGLITSLPKEDRTYQYFTGISVGALNMVELAMTEPGQEERAIEQLKKLWLTIKSSDIFQNWQYGPIQGFFFKEGAMDSTPERALIKSRLEAGQFKRKYQFGATDMSSGQVRFFDENSPKEKIVDYLMATSAFPGALPYQTIDGQVYSDGGCILNVNVAGAVNRCLKEGYEQSDIIVDIIVNRAKKELPVNLTDAKAYQMVMRYYSMNSYLKSWYDIYDAMMSYPGISFRYIISPTKSLPQYPLVPLDFKTEDLAKMYQIGLEDGRNAVTKSMSNSAEMMDEFRKTVLLLKYGALFEDNVSD